MLLLFLLVVVYVVIINVGERKRERERERERERREMEIFILYKKYTKSSRKIPMTHNKHGGFKNASQMGGALYWISTYLK